MAYWLPRIYGKSRTRRSDQFLLRLQSYRACSVKGNGVTGEIAGAGEIDQIDQMDKKGMVDYRRNSRTFSGSEVGGLQAVPVQMKAVLFSLFGRVRANSSTGPVVLRMTLLG